MLKHLCILVVGAALATTYAPSVRADEWKQIKEAEGITVWQKVDDGSSFVVFRSKGVVNAPIDKVTAVMSDFDRACEWMFNCAESATLDVQGADIISYNHTRSPVFFVSDRDVTVKTHIGIVQEPHQVHADFALTQDARRPERKGIVRVVRLSGFFEMRAVDRDHTEVMYQVDTDPGGSIPRFLVNWGAKDLPYETLHSLRVQVMKDGYDTQLASLHQRLNWSGFELPGKSADDAAAPAAGAAGAPVAGAPTAVAPSASTRK